MKYSVFAKFKALNCLLKMALINRERESTTANKGSGTATTTTQASASQSSDGSSSNIPSNSSSTVLPKLLGRSEDQGLYLVDSWDSTIICMEFEIQCGYLIIIWLASHLVIPLALYVARLNITDMKFHDTTELTPRVDKSFNGWGWILAFFCCTPIFCWLVPCCIDECHDFKHGCPRCNAVIGSYSPDNGFLKLIVFLFLGICASVTIVAVYLNLDSILNWNQKSLICFKVYFLLNYSTLENK